MADQPEESHVPVAGSLSATIIRKCPAHNSCPLDCPRRTREDLGEIASFDVRETRERTVLDRLKEVYDQWRH